jgi:hypothetical protein
MAMEWLYPELKKINPKDRLGALHESKDTSFDILEIIGIGIALVLVVTLTRYSVAELGALGRIGAALWNFVIAIPLLVIFAGPFYLRRTRRGLREYIEKHLRSEADQTQ